MRADSSETIVDGNTFQYAKVGNMRFDRGGGNRITDNTSRLNTNFATSANKPRHVILTGNGRPQVTQTTVGNNYFVGGWRGIDPDVTSQGLVNVNISNNRFVSMAGAGGAIGGAGVQYIGNYFNLGGGGGPTAVCDPTCSVTPGQPCLTDSDCGTCTSTFECVPEPTIWVGNPNILTGGTAHFGAVGNIFYAGVQAGGQCTVPSTNVGQICSTAGNACAGAAPTCTGTPAVCGGTTTEAGKRCCMGAGAVCSQAPPRMSWSNLRLTDVGHSELNIAGDRIL